MYVLLCMMAVFHIKSRLVSSLPKSCLLIVTGIVIGLMLSAAGQTGYTFNAATFFQILLPWIFLYAGYFLPLQSITNNIGVVVSFAIIGTLWNTFSVGLSIWCFGKIGAFAELTLMHTLIFAWLLAAVDPVAVLAVFKEVHVKELLCCVVLGESLLNNGVAMVSIFII